MPSGSDVIMHKIHVCGLRKIRVSSKALKKSSTVLGIRVRFEGAEYGSDKTEMFLSSKYYVEYNIYTILCEMYFCVTNFLLLLGFHWLSPHLLSFQIHVT